MSETFNIFVRGVPSSQGSKTGFRRKDGSIGVRPASKTERPWRQMLQDRISGAWLGPPWDGPIELTMKFAFTPPKNDKKRIWHHKRPDASKLQRAVEDALLRAGAITEDSRIVSWSGLKVSLDVPGVEIELRKLA